MTGDVMFHEFIKKPDEKPDDKKEANEEV